MQLIRGLLFYNTVYWKRASDGLNPPRLTPEERKILAPPKDLEVIKPREKPRARIDVARREAKRRQMFDDLARFRRKLPGTVGSRISVGPSPPPPLVRPSVSPAAWMQTPAALQRSPQVVTPVKRRRKRRPHRSGEDGELPAPGFLARLLKKFRL
jgi:hypothetical protein